MIPIYSAHYQSHTAHFTSLVPLILIDNSKARVVIFVGLRTTLFKLMGKLKNSVVFPPRPSLSEKKLFRTLKADKSKDVVSFRPEELPVSVNPLFVLIVPTAYMDILSMGKKENAINILVKDE